MNGQQIENGDKVMVTFPWMQDECPTNSNFHFGTVENVEIKKVGTVELLKYRVSGLDMLADADRVRLIEKGSVRALPNFVYLSEQKASEVYSKAYLKGWRGEITANNFNHDEFEILSCSENTYIVKLHFAESSDEVFASCDCLYFLNAKQLCKHISFVAIGELYSRLEARRAA